MSNLKDYKTKRQRIIFDLEQIDSFFKNILNDQSLKNSSDVIELQIERLAYLDQLRFLRPQNKKDIAYRNQIFRTFPDWARKNIPDEMHLLFHGTTLANTERILNSGRITSGKDRWTIHTSGDDAGEISISTKDFLEISMKYHMDLIESYKEYEWFVPAGSLFALKVDTKEYQEAQERQHISNIQLRKNPEQLYAVITTQENIDRTKWWLQKNNFPANKVHTFDSFKEKLLEDKIFFDLIKNYQKNRLN